MKRGNIRWAALAALLAGFAFATLLVAHFGFADVGKVIATAGWTGIAAVSGFQFLLEVMMGAAWWLLVRRRRPGAAVWTFIWGRLLRDAGSEVLPLSQVGGYVLGARAVMLRGIDAALAAASTVVDVTVEFGSQLLYTALGLLLLWHYRPHSDLSVPVLVGLVLAVAAIAGFVAAQRRKLRLFDRLAERMAQGWLAALAAGTEAMQSHVRAIHDDRAAMLGSFGFHLATWLASTVEAWIALRLLGAPLGIGAVLVIESLLYATRSVAFLVPNALGVQEGAYIVLGGLFGLPPDVALALSLVKRARDLVLGVPVLLIWQIVEGRRLFSGGRKRQPGGSGRQLAPIPVAQRDHRVSR